LQTLSEKKEPKVYLGVSVDREMIRKLDAMRGLASRSRLVEQILTNVVTAIEEKEKNENENQSAHGDQQNETDK
jgi:metal-responsive CopG/Arc/MetJ family transcriptional regulator